MPPPIDLTGHTYGRLNVLHEAQPTTYPRKWLCLCTCGTSKVILGASLRGGLTQSCGCLNKEVLSAKATTHGLSGTRLHSIWHNMKQRCQNANSESYSFYGALGISVCKNWEEFSPFLDWALASGYSDHLTLDREDGKGNYEPGNCRWVDKTTQSRNQKKRVTNSSGFTGVSYVPRLTKYQAYITLDYKKVSLGFFLSAEQASLARQEYIKNHSLVGFPTT